MLIKTFSMFLIEMNWLNLFHLIQIDFNQLKYMQNWCFIY